MLRKKIAQPAVVSILLIVQFIPLLLFPPDIFSTSSQQWWLPALLTALSIFATIKIIVQRTTELYPWYLISFSQGFNVISRLMMLMPHATNNVGGVLKADWVYIITNIVAVIISYGYIYIAELPDVRQSQLPVKPAAVSA